MAAPEESNDRRRIIEVSILVGAIVVFLAVSALVRWPASAPKKTSFQGIGVFFAAGLTLIMYSFLYRDNPLFKIAENLYVGVALGYSAVMEWYQVIKMEVYDPFFAAPTWEAFRDAAAVRAVPIVLGVLLLMQLSRKHNWLARYPYAVMIGWGAGIGIPITVHSFILEQLHPAIAPLTQHVDPQAVHLAILSKGWLLGVAAPVFGSLVILVGTVSVLFYFFFSIEHKGPARIASRIGILFLMVAFGASFGYTVMGRVSLLIGRAQFLLTKWLGINL